VYIFFNGKDIYIYIVQDTSKEPPKDASKNQLEANPQRDAPKQERKNNTKETKRKNNHHPTQTTTGTNTE